MTLPGAAGRALELLPDSAHHSIYDAEGAPLYHRLTELDGGAGELAEDQDAPVVAAAGHVLLGDEVHAVAQRRHEHHVAGQVERHQFLQRQSAVQVVQHRMADAGMATVDLANELLDLVTLVAIVLHRFPGRGGDLHHHASLGVERAVVEE